MAMLNSQMVTWHSKIHRFCRYLYKWAIVRGYLAMVVEASSKARDKLRRSCLQRHDASKVVNGGTSGCGPSL